MENEEQTIPQSDELLEDKEDIEPYVMTENALRARLKKRSRGRYISQFFVALTVSVGAICYGCMLGWLFPMIRRNSDRNALHVAPLVPLGFGIGAMVNNTIADKRGPRRLMFVVTPIQVFFWSLLNFIQNHTFGQIIIFLNSACCVSYVTCGITLLEDTVHQGNLMHMFMMFKGSIYVGLLLSFSIGMSAKYEAGHTINNLMFLSIFFVLIFLCPESPVFLYDKQPNEAEKALIFFRGKKNAAEDMKHIKKDAELRQLDVSARYMFLRKCVYKAIVILVIVYFFDACSCYYLFMTLGFWSLTRGEYYDTFGKTEDAVLIGSIYLIVNLISVSVNYSLPYGTRKPLIISSFFTFMSLSAIAAYLYVDGMGIIPRNLDWVRTVLLVALIISYEIGYGFCPDILLFDYLPSQVYPYVRTAVLGCKWIMVYIVLMVTLEVEKHYKGWICMVVWATINLIAFVFFAIFIIDSKDKTLIQLQTILGGNPCGTRSTFRSRHRGGVTYFRQAGLT